MTTDSPTFRVPSFEEGVGSYLLMEQPDQTSLLKKNAPITRQNVVEARMMVQASF